MNRANDPRWQELRRDKRSGFATFATVMAWLPVVVGITMLSVPGTQFEARKNPLYWLILIPFAWWAATLSAYHYRPIQFIRHAQLLAGPMAFVLLLIAAGMGHEITPFVVATCVSFGLAVLSWWLYSGSLLQERQSDL